MATGGPRSSKDLRKWNQKEPKPIGASFVGGRPSGLPPLLRCEYFLPCDSYRNKSRWFVSHVGFILEDMMSRPFRNFFLLNLLLSNILLGVPRLWAGVVSDKTSAPLASYLALSAYFDKLASAASEDPRIEFFAVKESQDRP